MLKIHSHEMKHQAAVEICMSKMTEQPQKNLSAQWQLFKLFEVFVWDKARSESLWYPSPHWHNPTQKLTASLCQRANNGTSNRITFYKKYMERLMPKTLDEKSLETFSK